MSELPSSGASGAGAAARFEGGAAAGLLMLPYAEISRALLRAHRNAMAMTEANRALAARLQDVLRRQQDLTMQIAEEAVEQAKGGAPMSPAAIFDHAAAAVRELGEAYIDAQLAALRELRDNTPTAGSAAKSAQEQPHKAPEKTTEKGPAR